MCIRDRARAGKITTDHGVIETPIFMPVGTVASVKGVHQRELKNDINPDIIPVSYTHLDVYKRQIYISIKKPILSNWFFYGLIC